MSRCPAARPAVRYRGTGEEMSRRLSCGGEPAAEKIARCPVHCRRGTAPVRDGPDGGLRRRLLVHPPVVLHPRPESAAESTPGGQQSNAGPERSRGPILSPQLPQTRKEYAALSLPTTFIPDAKLSGVAPGAANRCWRPSWWVPPFPACRSRRRQAQACLSRPLLRATERTRCAKVVTE